MTKRSQLVPSFVVQRCRGTAHEDIGCDAEAAKFLDRVLRRFCFLLTNGAQHGNQGHVDKGDVFTTDPELELTQGFHVRGRFNVADRPSEFDDACVRCFVGSIGWTRCDVLNPILDGVRDVGDDLHGFSKIVAATFGFQHLGVDLARCQIVVF